ncbi:MAG TPA: hypothetical protein VJT71_10925 [Pyrinomonadaceae bacterium]|nr:hypothetical protein [Pyrinomonadaceae bacterium]
MFCPQCGTESVSDELKFCRTCGANLKVIGKAVTLGEAIARSDSVPNKIKDLVKSLKIEKVTDEVARAMDKMNQELVQGSTLKPVKPLRLKKGEKTPEERRERYLAQGLIRVFWGAGLSIFLYFLSGALVLKLPPDVIAETPFEIEPVVRIAWLIGLLPVLSGIGHIIAGLTIRRGRSTPAEETPLVESAEHAPLRIEQPQFDEDETMLGESRMPPTSVTDRTTNIFKHKVAGRSTSEIKDEG